MSRAASKTKGTPSKAAITSDSMLDSLPHPVLMVDSENTIAYANVEAQAFFATSKAVMSGRSLAEYITFASPLLVLIDQVRAQGGSVNEYGVTLNMPHIETERLMDIQVTALAEDPSCVLIMLQERTMALKIDRQLSHRGAARSVSGMAAILAHEIKNPLSGIRGAAQLLEQAVVANDQALTRLICDETDRICKLVDRMEVFSNEQSFEGTPVNIHVVLEHVKQIAQNGFAKSIPIAEEYDPSLPMVNGDKDQLIQVFLNLIKNAAEAIGENNANGKGRITLTTAYRQGVRLAVPGSSQRISLPLEICVIDNGPGVPEEMVPYLFDPFITTKPSGTGLGLALVAKIVRDHGGIIECDAQERTTTFRILMPIHQDDLIAEDKTLEMADT